MIYHVFANRSNIGDWLSAKGIQSQLPQSPRCELLCDEPFIPATLDVLAGASDHDLVVIGGGGLFMDYFEPFWAGFEAISSRIPFCIWGAGACDYKSRPSLLPADLLRRILGRARLCIVRDELTRSAFAELELPAPVPCPSLLAVPRVRHHGSAVLHAVHYEITGEQGYERLCNLVRDFASREGRTYLETNNEVRAGSESSLLAELLLYADAGLVVSTRLHGCIIGLASGCRVIAISGDRKVESFMRAAGLGEWICELDDSRALRSLMQREADQSDPLGFLSESRKQNIAVGRRIAGLVDLADIAAGRST